LRLALTKLVEIVGEAAQRGDLDVLWATVTDDLPRVLEALGDD
jgi:hypothetical protein